MKNYVNRIFYGFILTLTLFCCNLPQALAETDPAQLPKAVQEIENIDAMRSLRALAAPRSQLASTLKDSPQEPTIQTFKEVCQPVGMRIKQLNQENGWQVKQIAQKYRNPLHAPDNLHAQMALAKFEREPELMGFWQRETLNNQTGTRYYRRINLEASCLACHGAKDTRPQFVKDKYPQDLAFDFRVGDLRGMYAAFIPDIQAALQETSQSQ